MSKEKYRKLAEQETYLDKVRTGEHKNMYNPIRKQNALAAKQKSGFWKFADGTVVDDNGNVVITK